MRTYRLTAAAKEDLLEIGRFTEKSWGKPQRNQYLRQLDDAFHSLLQRPELGRQADEIRKGYRCLSCGRHAIFYRVDSASDILIVRVLHRRMDAHRHL